MKNNIPLVLIFSLLAFGCKVKEVQYDVSEDLLFPDNLTGISGPIAMLTDSQLEQYCEKDTSSTLSGVRKYACLAYPWEEEEVQPGNCSAALDECLLNEEREDQSNACAERSDPRLHTENCAKKGCLRTMKYLRDEGCKGDILEYGRCVYNQANSISSLSSEELCDLSESEVSDLVSEDLICMPGEARTAFCF